MKRKGFTLIEMLVVLGIIGILMGAMMMYLGSATRSAQKARAQELVDNVQTSLGLMLMRNNNVWPADRNNALKTYGGKDGPNMGCVEEVARIFAAHGMLGVNVSGDSLKGVDKYGIVTPWAQNVLKHSLTANASTRVPSGGTIRDHIIYYAIDTDLDGIVEATVCGERIKVRSAKAHAIAWCAGADGVLGSGYRTRNKENDDNVYSWRRNQEVRDK